MGYLAVFFTLFTLSFSVLSSEQLQLFDLKTYDPVKVGLKDFTCEVRLKGITEKIQKDFAAIKLKGEVYYKLYWAYPGKVDFKIEGIPPGFNELRQNLKNLVVNRLDYLIPQALGKRFRGYELIEKKLGSGVRVIGTDPTNTLPINKVELYFDRDEKLKSYKSFSPLGFKESTFEYKKKSWSKNKWVLEGVEAKMIQGPQVTEIVTEMDFENIEGYGFPTEIKVETTQYVVSPEDNEKKNERKGESILTFSKYKINDGAALRYFRN